MLPEVVIVKQDYGSGLENNRLTTLMYFKRKCCIYVTKNDQLFIKTDLFFVKNLSCCYWAHAFFYLLSIFILYSQYPQGGRWLLRVYSLKYVNCNNISLIYGKLEMEDVITQRKK